MCFPSSSLLSVTVRANPNTLCRGIVPVTCSAGTKIVNFSGQQVQLHATVAERDAPVPSVRVYFDCGQEKSLNVLLLWLVARRAELEECLNLEGRG